MDLSFEGGTLDPSSCSKLSMDEKRELVYNISDWSGASEMLQSWSRQEILQILCAEMGKERKYTGLTKLKIIEHLLKLVSEKKSGECKATKDHDAESSLSPTQRASKRQRKTDNPSRIPVQVNNQITNNVSSDLGNIAYCKNSACKAALKQCDTFCKRCSCCICYQYDDNKDPSLWLTCSSEPPFEGIACGMSCHLDCALKHKSSGIGKDCSYGRLDGSFRCVKCGKVNDLLGCWRKQLIVGKDTRRVDILCYRVSLAQKLLFRTVKYQKLKRFMDEAVEKLEAEVGPLTGLPVRMGRGIVNRLSSGPEVQRLCCLALESLEMILSDTILNTLPDTTTRDSKFNPTVRFEDVCETSLAVVFGSEHSSANSINYTMWHRKAQDEGFPAEPTCRISVPVTRFVVTGLSPDTEYHFKVVSSAGTRQLGVCEVEFSTSSGVQDEVLTCSGVERSQSPPTNYSSLSNPSSVEDETNHGTPHGEQICNREDNRSGFSLGAIKCSGMDGNTLADADPAGAKDHDMQVVSSSPNSDAQKLASNHTMEGKMTNAISTDDGSDTLAQTGMEGAAFVGNSEASLPITPCRGEIIKDVQGRHARSKSNNRDLSHGSGKIGEAQDGGTSKKRSEERQDEDTANGHSDNRDFEYYVKVIRWLECEGHIQKTFRQKFLTWYSLRATPQETRVVKAFVDMLIEDPSSLAEQLVDAFSEHISSSKSPTVTPGFCMKLWH